jgi:hypothetical protein
VRAVFVVAEITLLHACGKYQVIVCERNLLAVRIADENLTGIGIDTCDLAEMTVVFLLFRNMPRISDPIWPGAKTEVATW